MDSGPVLNYVAHPKVISCKCSREASQLNCRLFSSTLQSLLKDQKRMGMAIFKRTFARTAPDNLRHRAWNCGVSKQKGHKVHPNFALNIAMEFQYHANPKPWTSNLKAWCALIPGCASNCGLWLQTLRLWRSNTHWGMLRKLLFWTDFVHARHDAFNRKSCCLVEHHLINVCSFGHRGHPPMNGWRLMLQGKTKASWNNSPHHNRRLAPQKSHCKIAMTTVAADRFATISLQKSQDFLPPGRTKSLAAGDFGMQPHLAFKIARKSPLL